MGLKGSQLDGESRSRRFGGCFLLAFGVGGDFGGDLFQGKLAGEVAGGVCGGVQEGVVDGEKKTAVFVGPVEVGDTPGGEVTEDLGVVELAATVVAAADECPRQGVPGPGRDASSALIEVAGVLMEEDREDGCAEHATDKEVGVVGTVPLSVTLSPLTVAGIGVSRLLDAGEEASGEEGDGIGGRTQSKAELLFGWQRRSVPDEAGVEVGKDTEDALLDLGCDLFLGDLLFGDGDLNVYG